jgi:hypothetical protein
MKIENNYIVYIHIRPDNNEPFYVGEGRPQRRFNRNGRNQYWHNIVNKNNGNFISEIVYSNLTKEQSLLKERELEVELLNKGYHLTNLAECGTYGGMVGKKHTLESIIKMKHPKHTEESKEKIRQSRLGKKDSIETFNKKSKASKGRIFSEESKSKKSQSLKDRKITWNLKGIKKDLSKKNKVIIQYDLENNFIQQWDSIKEASENINKEKRIQIGSAITKCAKGKQNTAYGYKWNYGKKKTN